MTDETTRPNCSPLSEVIAELRQDPEVAQMMNEIKAQSKSSTSQLPPQGVNMVKGHVEVDVQKLFHEDTATGDLSCAILEMNIVVHDSAGNPIGTAMINLKGKVGVPDKPLYAGCSSNGYKTKVQLT